MVPPNFSFFCHTTNLQIRLDLGQDLDTSLGIPEWGGFLSPPPPPLLRPVLGAPACRREPVGVPQHAVLPAVLPRHHADDVHAARPARHRLRRPARRGGGQRRRGGGGDPPRACPLAKGGSGGRSAVHMSRDCLPPWLPIVIFQRNHLFVLFFSTACSPLEQTEI